MNNLTACAGVREACRAAFEKKILVAAICAAPMALGEMGDARGKGSSPASQLPGGPRRGRVYPRPVCLDGKPADRAGTRAALPFGFAVLEYLKGKETAERVKQEMKYQ